MNSTNHNPIKLRWDKKADGRESAYLDFYSHGRRKKEFLKIYRGGSLSAKESKNNEKLALAILKKRIDDYNNGRAGVISSRDHRNFVQYMRELADKRNKNTRLSWLNAINHIKIYDQREDLSLADIDEAWCKGFFEYLMTKAVRHASNRGKEVNCQHGCRAKKEAVKIISPNTAKNYYNKLRNCIHDAIDEGLINEDPTKVIDKIKSRESHREYLDIEEVKLLMRTPYTNDVVCRAFLFSCITGLRVSDVRSLRWDMVRKFNGFARIDFSQTKTKGQVYLDIPQMAIDFMGEPAEDPSALIFSPMPTNTNYNDSLIRWVKSAGINKHITFHCSRHTAAVSLLTADADLYTVSKILGHSRIATTEIYAKIVDSKRREAMQNLQNLYANSTDKLRTKPAKNG